MHLYILQNIVVVAWLNLAIFGMEFNLMFFFPVVILAEDKVIQEKLAYYDLKVETMDEVDPIVVYPARVLSHIFAHLGRLIPSELWFFLH